jgi:hypothetical protein
VKADRLRKAETGDRGHSRSHVAQSGTISGVRESPGRLGTVKWQLKMRGVMRAMPREASARKNNGRAKCVTETAAGGRIHGIPSEILLNSPGGDLNEAMRIGRLIRSLLLRTQAPIEHPVTGAIEFFGQSIRCTRATCYCASACFFIWASGIFREGTQLFVHQPSFDQAFFGNLPPTDAIRRHRQMIAAARDYLSEMDIPEFVTEVAGFVETAFRFR